jgi:hypothetical protein
MNIGLRSQQVTCSKQSDALVQQWTGSSCLTLHCHGSSDGSDHCTVSVTQCEPRQRELTATTISCCYCVVRRHIKYSIHVRASLNIQNYDTLIHVSRGGACRNVARMTPTGTGTCSRGISR